MLDGQVYELVMQEHHTSDSEYSSLPTPTTQDSSGLCRDHGGDLLHELICGCPRAERKDLLLRTPVASEAEGGAVAPEVAKANGQTLRLSGQMIDLVAPQQLPKLPTPTASDWKNGRPGDGYGPNLPLVATHLFPTPMASEGTKAPSQQTSATKSKTGQVWLSNVAKDLEPLLGTPRANAANSSSKQVELGAPKSRLEDQVHTDWGKFEPAIRRWETILDRPAPEPTKPDGKDNNHRLSSKFTEWMMGLPDGWITDIGLKRNDELKACGNGVVPQQAELALSLLGINDILRGNNE
jgi:DNA (cytosine-5)-methyltransferase 1